MQEETLIQMEKVCAYKYDEGMIVKWHDKGITMLTSP
jgi:hypothetical protein